MLMMIFILFNIFHALLTNVHKRNYLFSISCLANIRLTYRKWEIENGTMILSHKKRSKIKLYFITLFYAGKSYVFFTQLIKNWCT